MKTLDSDEVMLAARGGDDAWVHADVAQALYDALEYIYEGEGGQDYSTLPNEAFSMARDALAAAGKAAP